MKTSSRRYGVAVFVASALAALPVTTLAQTISGILITYAPGGGATSPVPTLSEWGLLGLSVLLAAAALYGIRGKAGGKPLAAIALAAALAIGTYNGHQTMGQVHAVPAYTTCSPLSQCYMQNAGGGTINATDPGMVVDTVVTNSSGVTQTVVSVAAVDPNWDQIRTPVGTPICVAGLVVPSGTSCYIRINNLR